MSLENVLGKKYKLTSSENFDEYLKELGVKAFIRKFATAIYPIIQLTKTGDEWCLTTITPFKTMVMKFKDGEEFEQDTPDGRKAKFFFKIDGLTIQEVQRELKGKETYIENFFSEEEVKMIMKVDNVVSTRVYRLQK